MNLEEKARAIALANQAEALYTMSIGDSPLKSIRGIVLELLRKVATESFIQTKVTRTFQQKDLEGTYAPYSSMPVPSTHYMLEHRDGKVSFKQHVRILWTDGQVDDFVAVHTYTFDSDKIIDNETINDDTSFHRKA